ncbi:MAG: flagellar assembly protein FliX, partial [Pseudomonadota bacterium]
QTNDPGLTAVLDEIDLRAQVEIAKLDMLRRG